MLTGPVTILAWSFVRDDQPLADTARQVALALRDEVADLEAAGIRVIQVDEPALRELLPLRAADQAEYLAWAPRRSAWPPRGPDATQIHTHMCYAEFGDILTPSTPWTPTSPASRRPAPAWRSRAISAPPATRAGSARASTTSTPRACPARGGRRALRTALAASRPSGCGSTPTAA